MFPISDKTREITLIVEAKAPFHLLTVDAFEEMLEFEDILYETSEFTDTQLDGFRRI